MGDDENMFTLVSKTIELLPGLTPLTKVLLRGLLRWSQMEHRSEDHWPAWGARPERDDPVSLIVIAALYNFPKPIPLNSIGSPVFDKGQ
jgi:hypothetical protein